MDMEALGESVVPGILDAATDDEGAIYAAPMSISVKSLVWYPKAPFEKAGDEIPKSQEELLALTEQIKADGTRPWCIGIESGPATGWPATRLAGGLRPARRWHRGLRQVGEARDPVRRSDGLGGARARRGHLGR